MSESLRRKRNLDVVKLLCAFFVVCIHMPFPDELSTVILPLARMAVPVFFMITGFFYRRVKENGREKQQFIKVLKLTVFANMVYFVWGLLFSFITGSPAQYITQTLNGSSLLRFLLLNESPFEIHLWYLTGLLFALVILCLLSKQEKIFRASYCFIPILLLGGLLIGKYAPLFWETAFDLCFSRNALFVGLPYMLLGAFLEENMNCLVTAFGKRKWLLVLLTVLFSATSILESRLLSVTGMDTAGDYYLSTTFLACSVFILAVVIPDVKETNLLAKIGKATSTDIYIFHLIVKDVLAILLTELFGRIYPWVRPICVFAATVIFALVLKTAMGWLKRKRQEKVLC